MISRTKSGSGLPYYPSVQSMLRELNPVEPVYCIHPDIYAETAQAFLKGFPGRVLYAVKANDNPAVLRCLYDGGIRHFDCASVPEIELVKTNCPGASCYFMVPVALRGAARQAQDEFEVRHFMVDHASALESLAQEIDFAGKVVFTRMAVSHESAMVDLSTKFGAPPVEVAGLLARTREMGAEPALAFNTGTMVIDPDAYSKGINVAAAVLRELDFAVRLVDIGGGFPKSYPGYPTPELEKYFAAVREARSMLPLADNGELMAEPGRALAAPGLSAVVEVLQRNGKRLYLNDGMYGIFWELRFKGQKRFPARAWRQGNRLAGAVKRFKLFGPTCDSSDVLPGKVDLPQDIQAGDHIEFSTIGAYSLAGRTNFNGHFSNNVVEIGK